MLWPHCITELFQWNLIAAQDCVLFYYLKYKHLPVCTQPPAWFVVSKTGSDWEFITGISYISSYMRLGMSARQWFFPSQRVTVTFRAWIAEGGRGEEGRGCWESGGVTWGCFFAVSHLMWLWCSFNEITREFVSRHQCTQTLYRFVCPCCPNIYFSFFIHSFFQPVWKPRVKYLQGSFGIKRNSKHTHICI